MTRPSIEQNEKLEQVGSLDFSNVNEFADYWYWKIGCNVIPVDSVSKRPRIGWKEWQDKPIPKELHEHWKEGNEFVNGGYAIITGRIWRGQHKDKYLTCIDIDNKTGIEQFLSCYSTDVKSLDKLSDETLVVQHTDAIQERAHVYYLTDNPITKRSGISHIKRSNVDPLDVPAIEVKPDSSTYMIGPGSIHKNGLFYKIMGRKHIQLLNEEETMWLDNVLGQIYQTYSAVCQRKLDGLSSITYPSVLSEELRRIARDMRIVGASGKICEGSRSNVLISFTRLLLNYHHRSRNLSSIKEFLEEVNMRMCDPPLPENELMQIWNQDVKYLLGDSSIDQQNAIKDRMIDYDELCARIRDKRFFEYAIKTCQQTVKQENSLIRLILYTGLSAYTKDPLNLGIMAPTSEGKTYAVSEVIKLLPKQDVWLIGSMSPKVMVRDKGIQVDENYNPIGYRAGQLKERINAERDEEKKFELREQLENLTKNSKILIDLTNKVLVFLEPPHQDTWDILKSILSHDSEYIEHPYVYQTKLSGQEVKHIVTRGWPACIFCSAKDQSDWSIWPEIQSRFFITSPNMVKQKYRDSNELIAQRKGLPFLVQQQVIVTNEEIRLARECLLLLKDELLRNYDNNVWIPFQRVLSQSLPSERGTDVRITNRIFSLLSLITKVNAFSRPKLAMGGEILAVATAEDLEEALKLTHNITGIPSHKLDFFTNIFIPLFGTKVGPDRKIRSDGDVVEEEDVIALTTSDLADFYKRLRGKALTTDNITKTYLQELKNNGLIDEMDSKLDRRRKIYYPLVDTTLFQRQHEVPKVNKYTNVQESYNNLEFFRLKLSNNYRKLDKNWLEIEIWNLIKFGIGRTNIFKLLDEEQNELCICRFIQKYSISGDLTRFFQGGENCVFSSKAFGKMLKMEDKDPVIT